VQRCPVRRHPRHRMSRGELDHDATGRMVGERGREGREIRDVVDDVVAHDDVCSRSVRRDGRPRALDGRVLDAGVRGARSERIEQDAVGVDTDDPCRPAPTPTSSTLPPGASASRATRSDGVSSARASASSAAAMNTVGSKKYGGSGAAAMSSSGIAHRPSISAHRSFASCASGTPHMMARACCHDAADRATSGCRAGHGLGR